MANLTRDIKYVNKDFDALKESLIEYSKQYFPNTYNDFTDESIGMLFIEMASYVGDVLSFYIDNQFQETFPQNSRQKKNLYKHAYSRGYTPKITTAASANIDFYQLVPATLSGSTTVPDFDYCLKVPAGNTVTSEFNENISFTINDEIDFSFSSSFDPTEVSVYSITSNQPDFYLLKKTRKSISATINTTFINFGNAEKFSTATINANNIIGILDVVDSDGNMWYEVPVLAQGYVFDSIRNSPTTNPTFENGEDTPNILMLKEVNRRFVTRFTDSGSMQLEFGAGTTGLDGAEITPNPDNVGLGLPFEKTKLTTAFSPVNFVFTNTYGMAPSNTTLTIRYWTGGGVTSNVEAGELNQLDTNNITFLNPNLSNSSLADTVFNSLAASNELSADGGKDGDTVEELRQNSFGAYQTQLRTVTTSDWLIRTLSMPSNLGSISKAYVEPVKVEEYQLGELPSILDLYVLTYDANKNLKSPSNLLKQNLKTYLSEYRMVNDSIKIKNAFIINIGVEFDVTTYPNANNNEVISNCIDAISDYFNIDKWQINEPILLKELQILLDKIEGVQTIKKVKIINKAGSSLGYSEYAYDIEGATINNVVYPSIDPMIFELKFPNSDIKGRSVGV